MKEDLLLKSNLDLGEFKDLLKSERLIKDKKIFNYDLIKQK